MLKERTLTLTLTRLFLKNELKSGIEICFYQSLALLALLHALEKYLLRDQISEI